MVWIICNEYWTSCKNYPTLIETIIYKLDFFTIPYIQYFRHRICWNYITCHIFIITSNTICNIWHFFVNEQKISDTYWQKNWQTVTSCGFVTFYKLKNHFFPSKHYKIAIASSHKFSSWIWKIKIPVIFLAFVTVHDDFLHKEVFTNCRCWMRLIIIFQETFPALPASRSKYQMNIMNLTHRQ